MAKVAALSLNWRGARSVLAPTLFTVAFVLAWELIVRWFAISSTVIVAPTVIGETIGRNFPLLLDHTYSTAAETVEGFVLATFCGILLGSVITISRYVRQALYPNLVLFQLIPKIALAPLFIIWLGVDSPSRLTFAVFMAFFPIVVTTASGLVGTRPDAVLLGRSLTATNWQIFTSIRFPFAIPHIFAGLKIGVTMAMIGIIVGEFVTAQRGLGYVIMFASSAGETALLYAALVLLCAMGLMLYGLVLLAELLARRWYGAPFVSAGFI